jgi:3-vinyl bacteriochlorophyllide hydratase
MRQLKANRSSCEVSGPDHSWMSRVPNASHHSQIELSNSLYSCCDAQFTFATDPAVWRNLRFLTLKQQPDSRRYSRQPLYSVEEKQRRDATPWTLVQGILAPVQFLAFLVSLALVLNYLATGGGLWIATCSIVIKTLLLYAIMVTGSIWERVVFGRYLFARAFFWEDVFSILVLALHTAYLVAIIFDIGSAHQQMALVLAAYASYAINATQFLLKLRAARLQDRHEQQAAPLAEGAK